MSGVRRVVAVLLLGVLSALLSVPAQASEPLRVLIVGDSVAHGKVGDYTWRYRLWKEFERQDRPVDFVGPHNGVLGGSAQDYADPHFDSDHAARWGASFVADGGQASGLARSYRPDVLVLALGLNDLTWGHAPPDRVLARMAQYVTDVRQQAPDAQIVLARVPQHWFHGVPEFNALVDSLASSMPRTVVAELDRDFTDGMDTYDPAHPSELGERKIARAVAAAFASLGHLKPESEPPAPTPSVSPTPTPTRAEKDRSVELKPIVIGKPTRLKVRIVGKRVRVMWRRAPDAKRYKITVRGHRKMSRITKSSRWTSPRLRPGRYAITVRAVHGKDSVRKVVRVR